MSSDYNPNTLRLATRGERKRARIAKLTCTWKRYRAGSAPAFRPSCHGELVLDTRAPDECMYCGGKVTEVRGG